MINISGTKIGFCQKWDQIDDSTYNNIIQHRFDKNNILIGSTANFKIHYSEYKVIEFGIKPQAGYFIANQWLLMGNVDFQYTIAVQDSGIGKANYFQTLAGPAIRYYLKPKPRVFFGQVAFFAGKEKQSSQDSEYEEFSATLYGCSAAFGLSVFIRKFELELMLGLNYSYNSYFESYGTNPFVRINVSYIFQKY